MAAALRLRPPRLQDEVAGRRAHEMLYDYNFFLDYDPRVRWPDLVRQIDDHRHGIGVPPGRVPAAFLMAWVGDDVVGRTSIRFELNDYLALAGGHIGYAVLPAHRGKGHATEILRQGLIVARAHGVDDVLVTCDVDNIGSRTVIERCGGEFDGTIHDPKEDLDKLRYWFH